MSIDRGRVERTARTKIAYAPYGDESMDHEGPDGIAACRLPNLEGIRRFVVVVEEPRFDTSP